MPGDGFLAPLAQPSIILAAVAIAFIASAETLLSAAAVDRMHDGARTDYNKELRAQGLGNLLCGVAGGLPMTGVIVRSSANVQAGAKTRLSTVLHGVWILGFVALLPWLLREIPMAALGAVLVVTGWRLVSLDHVKHLLHAYGKLPALIWAVTFVLVVATDLLTGVLVGLALSLVELIPYRRSLKLGVGQQEEGEVTRVSLKGSATFLTLTKLTSVLEALPDGRPVKLDLDNLRGMDHTTAQMLHEWLARRRKSGAAVEVAGPDQFTRSLMPA
jgi:MFS superfamily sulfate permease-like transporter